MLSLEVAAQRLAHPGLTIYEFDADRVLNKILADPTAIGISNVTGQACDDCGAGDQPNPTLIAENPNEFLFWDNVHFTAPVHDALGKAAFQAITRASAYLINEDFDQVPTGERPKNTMLFDSNSDQAEPRPWGPGIVQVEDGKLRFQTTGPVPFRSPEEPLETGFMSLTWGASETDEAFANGFLRATVQASTASDANLLLRGNVESLSGYLFASVGPSGKFEIHRFDETGSTFLGEITDPAFTLAEEWIIEAGSRCTRSRCRSWCGS